MQRDDLKVILPKDHPLAGCEKFPVQTLSKDPFLLLEKGGTAEISEIYERNDITVNVNFTTWDDYDIMSMVESGLGISILPELILRKIPYEIVIKDLDVPAYRDIGLALRSRKNASVAVKKFIKYLKYR